MDTSQNQINPKPQTKRQRKRKEGQTKSGEKAKNEFQGALLVDQQIVQFKSTGVLPSAKEVSDVGGFNRAVRKVAKTDLNLLYVAHDQSNDRYGQPNYRSWHDIDPTVSRADVLTKFETTLLEEHAGIVDSRQDPYGLMMIAFDQVYGSFMWPKDCPKLMFPSEIAQRMCFIWVFNILLPIFKIFNFQRIQEETASRSTC
jgi:hypothetical protein